MNKTGSEIAKTVFAKIVEKVVDLAFLAVPVGVGAVALGAIRWFVGATVTIPGWALATLSALLIVATAVAARLWWRGRALSRPKRAQQFQPIPVRDGTLEIGWTIVADPSRWIHSVNLDTASEGYLITILDGPFHAADGCHQRLETIDSPRLLGRGPTLAPACPGCRKKVFDPVSHPAALWLVRSEAVAELQRLARIGADVEKAPVVLMNPLYWRYMTPVTK